jgi:peptidoglycan/xylan/chitin deacetylase (PgdA/CDA1 family)
MREIAENGHDIDIHSWDHIKCHNGVNKFSYQEIEIEFLKSFKVFTKVLGCDAKIHGAAGWQTNQHLIDILDRSDINFSSDTRGGYVFRPTNRIGREATHLQIPTTLPKFDEVLGLNGINDYNLAEYYKNKLSESVNEIEIFTVYAEIEVNRYSGQFESILKYALESRCKFVGPSDLPKILNFSNIKVKKIKNSVISGSSGEVCV